MHFDHKWCYIPLNAVLCPMDHRGLVEPENTIYIVLYIHTLHLLSIVYTCIYDIHTININNIMVSE